MDKSKQCKILLLTVIMGVWSAFVFAQEGSVPANPPPPPASAQPPASVPPTNAAPITVPGTPTFAAPPTNPPPTQAISPPAPPTEVPVATPTPTVVTPTAQVATEQPVNPPPPAGQAGTPDPFASVQGAPVAANTTKAQYQADVAQFQNWVSQVPPAPTQIVQPPAATQIVETTTTTTTPVVLTPPRVLMIKKPRVLVAVRPKCGCCQEPVVISPPLSYKESQEVMLKSAPVADIPPDPEAEAAFNALLKQNVPLSPQQVVRLRQFIDNSQRAASIPPTIPPKPVSSTLMINLAPGTTPPAIRIAQGYVSSIVFVDSLGSPWPIASYDVGDPKATTIQWDGKSNILLIQAISPYSDSNFVVRLVGLQTPITLELISGQRVVDYRTDIHVPGIGPNSKDLPIGNVGLPESANQLLLSVLDGVAPSGSRQLCVKGGDGQAWLLGDKIYFRSRLTVLSPGWVGKMSSPDGMMAYEMPKTSSILVSQYGNPVELRLEGF